MNIYIVKVFNDISNNYQGLGSIDIYPFSSYEKAVDKLNEVYEEKITYFEDEYKMSLEELDYSKEEDSFSIDNGRDYFSAEIIKEVL